MKKIFTLTVIIATALTVFAQSPQKISYQAVIRNTSGGLVTNHTVGMKISILRGSTTGTVVYSETYNPVPQTNANGLVTIEIGNGTPVTGTFSGIDWSGGPYYLKTEADPAGGTSYTVIGTSQILSVPYALYSRSSETIADNSVTSAKIVDGAVATVDLANSSVTSAKIADGTISTSDLADNSITSSKIVDATITAADLAASAVTTDKISPGAVTGTKIAQAGATSGQVLKWSGTFWGPSPDATGGGLTLPYSGNGNVVNNAVFIIENTGNGDGITGVSKSGSTSVVHSGISGLSFNSIGAGVTGYALSASGNNSGVYGSSASTSGYGVYGFSSAQSGTACAIKAVVLSVDGYSGHFHGGKFYVQGNTGIGVTDPSSKLDIAGQIRIRGGSPGDGKVLTSDAVGLASWQTPAINPWQINGSNIYYNSGNVGFGISSPAALLHAQGTGSGQGNVVFTGEYKNTGPGNPPVSGAGTRMMWYPDKAAFRAGYVSANQWDASNIGYFSGAIGYSTTASGRHSTAIGYLTIASGEISTAVGSSATASGGLSFSAGYVTVASGSFSTARGDYATASGDYSTAIGRFITAPSYFETVIGCYNSTYTPASSTAWNDGDRLFVISNGTSHSSRSNAITVLKNGNTGIGTNTPAAKLDISASQGPNLIIRDSDGGNGRPGIQFVNNNIHYIAGDDGSEEIFGIYSGFGSVRNYAARLNIHGPAGDDWGKYISLTHDGNHGRISTDAGYLVLQPAGQRVGVGTDAPTQSLDINGTLRVRGMTTGSSAGTVYRTSDGTLITGSSDIRLKENIAPLENILEKVLQLNGVTFSWKDDPVQRKNIGFIAQDFEKVIPELVFTNEVDGYKGINYAEVSAVIVEAFKEQQNLITNQQKQIDELKDLVNTLIANQTGQDDN